MMLLRVRAHNADDRGAALIVTIAITAIITALAVISATVSINNMKNATRDKQANSALATSEAGVAEAIEFLRSGTIGLSALTCTEPPAGTDPATACPTSATNPANWWTNSQAPKEVPVDGAASCSSGQTCYKVWIGTKTAYKPPLQPYGIYSIHSTGKFGGGPATRSVIVDVKVKPYPFPIGVYADTLTGGGNAGLTRESLFTRSCVSQRQMDSSSAGGLRFAPGVDLQYDLPPTAHTTDHLSTETNCGTKNQTNGGLAGCSANGFVHPCNPSGVTSGCNPNFPYDQSMDGKPESSFAGSACYKSWTSPVPGSGKQYPVKSEFTIQDLQSYGYRPRGLSDQVYDTLKARAQGAGTYFTTSTSPYTALNALGGAQAVLYYEVPSTTTVSLGPSDIPAAYLRQENMGPGCSPSNLVIVVQGGNLRLNSVGSGGSSPTGIVASMFVPDGSYSGQGNIWVIGTIFANQMQLTGTQDFRLDQCFVENPPSVILDVTVQGFREDDTRDAP